MKVYFKTFGCTLNQAETEAMKYLLIKRGYRIVETPEEADIIVVNTCTVKLPTENKIMAYLEKLKQKGKKFIITGCLVVNKHKLKKFNVPLVWPDAIGKIEEALHQNSFKVFREECYLYDKIFTPPIARIHIQRGCLNRCNYCQTKQARPKMRSMPVDKVGKLVRKAVLEGCKEIQLTGTDMAVYGKDLGTNLVELVNNLNFLAKKGGVMVRIGMMHPGHTRKLNWQKIFENPYVYKFVHIPVQSGSEKVVKEMNRGHTVDDFIQIAKEFRKRWPFGTVETDIIVGYPTETEEDFEKTVQLLETVKPDVVNISKFSMRWKTPASFLKQLPTQTIKKRSVYLTELVSEIRKKRLERFLGKDTDILITEKGKGRTAGYTQVIVNGKLGSWIKAEIVGMTETSLIGKRLD